jgi:hypothetical protein
MNTDAITVILQDRLARINALYTLRFYRQSRLTRDLQVIDEIVADAAAIDELAAEAGDADLSAAASARLEFYLQERNAIAEAKRVSEESVEASILGARANVVAGRYRRHFAGRDRGTRDLGLLAELIGDMRAIQQRMQALYADSDSDALARNLDVVSTNINLYLSERGEIVAARGIGLPQQQADVLAEVANAQFGLYRAHFAGKARLGRRPGLLQRIIDNLEQVHDRMGDHLRDQLKAHADNRQMVVDQLDLYRSELRKIVVMRRIHPLSDIVDTLRNEINAAIAEASEQLALAPTERDLGRLSDLCDVVGEAERQLRELTRSNARDADRQLSLVSDVVAMLEREYADTQQAKGPS